MESLKKSHANKGTTCKLHTERPLLLMWNMWITRRTDFKKQHVLRWSSFTSFILTTDVALHPRINTRLHPQHECSGVNTATTTVLGSDRSPEEVKRGWQREGSRKKDGWRKGGGSTKSLSSSHQGSHYSWTLPDDSLKKAKIKRTGISHLNPPRSLLAPILPLLLLSLSHPSLVPSSLPFIPPPDCFWLKLQKTERKQLYTNAAIFILPNTPARPGRGGMCARATHTHTLSIWDTQALIKTHSRLCAVGTCSQKSWII